MVSATRPSSALTTTVHATSVVMDGHAVLIRGASGTGKSDLALRLIGDNALLLSDDQTILTAEGKKLLASSPTTIAGLIEVRGVGVVTVPECCSSSDSFPVALIVDLVRSPAEIDRIPDQQTRTLCGIEVLALDLFGFSASATQVVKLTLDVVLGRRSIIC